MAPFFFFWLGWISWAWPAPQVPDFSGGVGGQRTIARRAGLLQVAYKGGGRERWESSGGEVGWWHGGRDAPLGCAGTVGRGM